MKLLIKNNFERFSILVIIAILAVMVMFGTRKQGFYVDEYYIYTVANGTQFGIAINPGEWNDTSDYLEQLTSNGDENFHFDQVYKTEADNNHPPLYYYLIHFASSFLPGVFSKWIGLSVNIILLIPTLIIVKKLAWILSGNDETITILTMLFFGLSPVTVSMVMLTRMYLLLGMWTLLYAYIHVVDLEREKLSIAGFLLPVFITGFLGFLTHYFFVVVMFFITFVYAFYLFIFCRRYKDSIIYGLTAILSLVCTYFPWPFSYFHIFMGDRGQGAFSEIRDLSNSISRIRTQIQWLNKMVFGGSFIIYAIILVCGTYLLIAHLIRIKKDGKGPVIKSQSVSTRAFILLMISSLLNFFALTQIALMDVITCCRQVYTSYALFLVLLPAGIYRLLGSVGRKYRSVSGIVTAILIVAPLLLGHIQKNVLFLYENEKILTDYAKEHPDAKVVMFENDDGMYDSRIQELIMYPKVYYVGIDDMSDVIDPVIASADELLVYVTTEADPETCFKSIYDQNDKIKTADHLVDCYGYFRAYLLH